MTNYSEGIQNSCEHCGQQFYAERRTKRFCSDSCRQLAYLERRARQVSNASFVEEIAYETIKEPDSDNSMTFDNSKEAPIELETIQDNIPPTLEIDNYCPNKRSKSKLRKTVATSVIQPSRNKTLALIGGIVLAKIAINFLINQKLDNNEKDPL